MPDALLDPAATVESRHQTRLAFIAALRHLPGRQRAVLILRDVLAFRVDEDAELLDTTTAAANGALQRARARLATVAPAEDKLVEPTDPEQRALVDQVRQGVRERRHRHAPARADRGRRPRDAADPDLVQRPGEHRPPRR